MNDLADPKGSSKKNQINQQKRKEDKRTEGETMKKKEKRQTQVVYSKTANL